MENPMTHTPTHHALAQVVYTPGMSARYKAVAGIVELAAQGLLPKGLDTTLAVNEFEAVIKAHEIAMADPDGICGASLEAQLVNKLAELTSQ